MPTYSGLSEAGIDTYAEVLGGGELAVSFIPDPVLGTGDVFGVDYIPSIQLGIGDQVQVDYVPTILLGGGGDIRVDYIPGENVISCVGTVSASISHTLAVTATFSGVGTVGISGVAQSYGLTAAISGIATLSASFRIPASASISGVASITGSAAVVLGLAADITCVVSLEGTLGAEYTHICSISAVATLAAAPVVTRSTVNPTLSGSLVPVTNQAKFLLSVATTPVSLSHPYYNVDSFRFSYEGKELSFSEIATPTFGRATWQPEQWVTMDIDFGYGLTRYFNGRIKTRNHRGVNQDEGIVYNCEGVYNLANEVTLINTNGRPEITFTVGSTVTTTDVNSIQTVVEFSKTVKDAVFDLFTVMTSPLNANSISTNIDTYTLNELTGRLPETVQFRNTTFSAAVQRLLDLNGRRLWWDDPTNRWYFVDVLRAPVADTRIESTQIQEAVFDMSTEDRYTAVRLLADDKPPDNIRTKSTTLTTNKGTFSIQRTSVNLIPHWLPELQGSWSYFKMYQGSGNSQTLEDEYFWVYRRYQIPNGTEDPWPGTPIRVYHETIIGSTVRYEAVDAKVNFRRKSVVAKMPIITQGNAWVPGDVPAPGNVTLVYYPLSGISGTVVTSVDTAGNPTLSNTTTSRTDFLDEVRYPTTGFEGTAKTMFNIEREKVEIVAPTEVTVENARAMHDLYKDVLVRGSIPFAGDPIREFINLNTSMKLDHATKLTGISTLTAMVLTYTYEFGKPGRSTVEVNTDKRTVIRV